jgi:hypothetical protein
MPQDIRITLSWFLKNLELQLEDIALEQSGHQIDTYFDTVDVYYAVVGFQAFLLPSVSFRRKIEDFAITEIGDTTLVHALYTSGILGQVKMLPPHQAEFLNLLNINFGLGESWAPTRESVHTFLDRLVSKAVIKKSIAPLMHMNHPQQLEYVHENAEVAISLFKFVELVRGLSWQSRLTDYIRRETLRVETPSFEYISLSQKDEFAVFRKAFDAKRRDPRKVMNNIADAFALSILFDMKERVKSNKAINIPHFFLSTTALQEVLLEPEVRDLLTFEVDGKPHPVFRDTNYFMFKGTFRHSLGSNQNNTGDSGEAFEELKNLKSEISAILKAQKPLSQQSIEKIKVGSYSLSDIIHNIGDLTFYAKVWTAYSRDRYKETILDQVDLQIEQLQSDALKGLVEESLKQLKTALETNVRVYQWFSTLWSDLERAHDSFLEDYNKEAVVGVNWQFGIHRFNFGSSEIAKLEALISSLVSRQEESEKAALNFILAVLIDLGQDVYSAKVENTAAICVLWVFKLDEQIVRVLTPHQDQLPDELLALMAASMLRASIDLRTAREIIDHLESVIERWPEGTENLLSSTLAYLCFHYWKALGHFAHWRPQQGRVKSKTDLDGSEYIEKAVLYANSAFKSIGAANRQKVYTLNQYLYYLIEIGRSGDSGKMDEAVTWLSSFKDRRDFWHYTFDDTLARYYHFMATQHEGDNQIWNRLIDNSLDLMKEAMRFGWRDEQISAYNQQLQAYHSSRLKK